MQQNERHSDKPSGKSGWKASTGARDAGDARRNADASSDQEAMDAITSAIARQDETPEEC